MRRLRAGELNVAIIDRFEPGDPDERLLSFVATRLRGHRGPVGSAVVRFAGARREPIVAAER